MRQVPGDDAAIGEPVSTDSDLQQVPPENQAAFFGGDTDNFTYPRFCLDVAFFRVYDEGAPAETPHHLTVKREGPEAEELVFVAGHPGSTDRLFTYDQLEYQRGRNGVHLRSAKRH